MERGDSRLVRGESYALALAQMPTESWTEADKRLAADGYRSPASMILLHPEWYGGASSAGRTCPVRGDRRYSMLYPPAGTVCGSSDLWGYPCPIVGRPLQPDHRFPFALGGPTVPTNAIWLCDLHNAAKSADWHLEVRSPSDIPWFVPTVDVIRQVLRRLA